MASKFQMPEITCLEPDNYRKYFRALCWVANRKLDKKSQKKIGKKDKLRRTKATGGAVGVCLAPTLLRNPSHFAVYATVRKLLLSRWRQLRAACSEGSEDSDNEEASCSHHQPPPKVPKITGIGLRMVFSLVSQARFSDAQFCEHSLKALLDVLQGHTPEEMAHEPNEIISTLHAMLVEIASGSGPTGRLEVPTNLTALSSSCLIALSVARGEAELILNAVASLIMTTPPLAEQYVQVPTNLTTLQRSVQTVILDVSARNQWVNYGVPHQALVSSFPVDLPSLMTSGPGELIVRSLASDGCFLYVYTSKGLLKIGSGYGSSIRQHIYLYKPDFFASDRHGWLGYCKNKLYVRIGRKKPEVFEINKETLEVNNVIKLDPGNSGTTESKSAVFTDGNQLGLILLTTYDNLLVKMYDVSSLPERGESTPTTLTSRKDLNVHLLRRRTLALGRAPFEDGMSRRSTELETPIAMQFDDNDEDPLVGICAGQDFGLLSTATGKVYYTGKGTSLGYKVASPHTGRWTLMKETLFNRNEPNVKKCKVIQVAVGHEGVHAILVLDNGNALFTGIARRGEDGDSGKHRRTPKPTRPKKITKIDGHYVVYAACNYGSTALVTRQGLLFMFGKDTQHCDDAGVVTALRHERVVQVALGKAHAIALSNFGHVYTFGINNKSQCGREFGYTKEKMYPRRSNKEELRICEGVHSWFTDYCRVCTLCRQCTGFAANCHCASMPIRVPGDRCGCGEGESGCNVCGICRRCAEASTSSQQEKSGVTYDDADVAQSEPKNEKETAKEFVYEMHSAGPSTVDPERDAGVKVSSLPPSRVAVPGGHRVTAIACGLHHSVLLTEHGEVLTFGSNQLGQLGAGDIAAHHRIVRVRVPRASAIAAGSNHTAVLTRDGELFTFGCYQKGSLGRPRIEDLNKPERSAMWYALPGRVPRLGPRHACKAVWVTASGDQTFVQVSQSVIKTDTLFSSTITANSNSIVILPNRPEHTFKCITINRLDGTCNAWTGSEQVDFVNTLATLDPLYDVLWCYQPQMRVIKCYNILAFDPNKLLRCFNDSDYAPETEFEYPNYGLMRRLEDFKDLETFEKSRNNEEKTPENLALTNMSVLNQDLAIPNVAECFVTRMHAALHLMGCLDSLTYAHDNKLTITEYKEETTITPVVPVMEDFLTVNRFGSHGGGWGYSGQSVEAIRFMCDTDIILGGYGLFGGRGDYTAKIKLYDIGLDGGDQEGDGEILAESEEIVYECAPRDRFPVLFDAPISLAASRWYVAWACINGPSSDCGSAGQAMVINDDVGFHFKTSKKSNNGTDVNAGQIPCLLYNVLSPEQAMPIRHVEKYEPVIVLSRNVSRKVTVACFKSLIILMQWSWKTFRDMVFETNGLVPINYQKLSMMKHQKRLVYVIKACLRLVKSYINEIYPQNNRRRNSHEYMSYFESIGDVRNFIQLIMSEPTPTCAMLPRRPGKARVHRVCFVQFALELTNSILKEAHETVTSCFHAFFPTPTLKWNHLCSLLFHVKDGKVPAAQVRELTATCAAMCASRSLQDVLQYIVPVTHSCLRADEARRTERSETKVVKDTPSKSATVPRSSHLQKPPPVPPRMNNLQKLQASTDAKSSHMDWHLMDVVPRLLDIVVIPIKQQMATRQCSKSHDHGEIGQQERLAKFCSKLVTRIIAELSYSTAEAREELDTNAVKHLITPSRFIRVNQNRAWNTGNGSPDAICFTVDRPGIMLVGACVYGGLGNYEYTLELMHDLRTTIEEPKPTHCWISVDVTHGTFTGADCQHDMATIKFERPILLKEEYRYAIRLCNHGGRTVNGDCGLPSVKGPDGTTFNFASCSLSFNGTTLARGQIPCLIYYGTSTLLSNAVESTDAILTTLRTMTIRVASMAIDRSAELLCSLRNELSAEELRRNIPVLQHSPVVNTLLPYALANLEVLDDTKSSVQLLEMIHKILPHVAAMNLLVPSTDELSSSPTHYYTWVESDHPYQPATVTNMRALFPSSVSWVVLEMDPRSITAQPEDTLTIYAAAGVPKQKCQCVHENPISESPFRKRLIQMSVEEGEPEDLGDDGEVESNCIHHNRSYISVTPRLANVSAEYPQKALLIPGNEVIFSLETASDYLSDYSKSDNTGLDNRYGFRCLCIGYEDTPFTTQRQGLLLLEMELAYAGAACASRLLAPDLELPPMSFTTLADIQFLSVWGGAREGEPPVDNTELTFISRGLELSSPPTIHQVLDGQSLTRGMSTEHQFLTDFVAGTENTAGGRLARWLAPMSRVEPSLCELKAPTKTIRPSIPFTILIYIRDQYGDPVISPSLKVEMIVQRMDDNDCQGRTAAGESNQAGSDVPYQTTMRDTMCFHAITMMKAYQNYSFEELRLASGIWFNINAAGENASGDSAPTERVPINAHVDGSYLASWVPRTPGQYVFTCMLDERPAAQEITLEVLEPCEEESDDKAVQTGSSCLNADGNEVESLVLRFAINYSAGLRVRASPSLQAEEIGQIPPGASVAFVEEVVNVDGAWVRLNEESMRAYTFASVGIAWCLQHNRHLDMLYLVPVESSDVDDDEIPEAWSVDPQAEANAWNPEDDDVGTSDFEERKFPFSIDLGSSDSDEGSSPFVFGAEPSKRSRQARKEAASSAPSPRRFQRKYNGNDWWSAKQRLNETVENKVKETAIGVRNEPRSNSRLAQASTQTSPDTYAEDALAHMFLNSGNAEEQKEGKLSPRSGSRDGSVTPAQRRGSPPPLPARGSTSTSSALPSTSNIMPSTSNVTPSNVSAMPSTSSAALSAVSAAPSTSSAASSTSNAPSTSGALPATQPGPSTVRATSSTAQAVTPTVQAASTTAQASSSLPKPTPYMARKHALSPTQAECLRAIFAALLWHEGIVHDAIACAAFLKFHPQLPKQGARVLTRGTAHDPPAPRPQRHSVEVAAAGQYLSLHPSTLESLTRSGTEARASRDHKADIDEAIKEEDVAGADASNNGSSPSVVNVLPPALRALVALWDTLYDADQLAAATDKFKKEAAEKQDIDDSRSYSGIRKRKDWRPSSMSKAPYSVRCELCGGASVPPPLGAHMRHAHAGCRAPATSGYDRAGMYRCADATAHAAVPAVCGQLAQAYHLWYMFCEKCREKTLRSASALKQTKSKVVAEINKRSEPEIDHRIIKDNALFLLDVASITNQEAQNSSSWHEESGRSPPTPPGSMWQPAPPFQCLPAFGAAPRTSAADSARYHSLGRPPPPPPSPLLPDCGTRKSALSAQRPRVQRSVSMGQAGRGLLAAARPPLARSVEPDTRDTYSTSAGSSLLAQPSAALRRLIGSGDDKDGAVSAFETPRIDPATLFRSPVLAFVLSRRDLQAHRQKMDAAARINTVRQYACEALNWLLRSSTQPTCVHDVMWWFCEALSQFSSTPPSACIVEIENQDQLQAAQHWANDGVPQRETAVNASTSALCPGGRSVRGARAAMHALLGSVSALAPSLHPSSAPGLQAVRCWALQYSQHDRSFLHRSQVFSVISRILSHGEDGAYEEGLFGALHESYHTYHNKENFVWTCPEITGWCDVTVSSRNGMAGALTDGSTETFWESGDEDRNKAKWIQVACPSCPVEDRPYLVCLHVDNTRDTVSKTLLASFLFSSGSNEMAYMYDTEIDIRNATWVCYSLPRIPCAATRVRCELRGPEAAVRVRQVRVFSVPRAHVPNSAPSHALQTLVEHDTLRVFRLLTSQVFGKLLEWEHIGMEANESAAANDGAITDDSDLREHVVGILFAGHKLTTLQRQVMTHIVCAIRCEATRVRDDWETVLLCSDAVELAAPHRAAFSQDNYCFEMLSLLLALSGSAVGRAHLAQRSELLCDLLSLLHTGSERVQRQVISLLRRMILEIPPQRALMVINFGVDMSARVTLLDYLVAYLAKAITVQVKVKGSAALTSGSVTMGSSVTPAPPASWFMRGQTTKKHAHLVARLLLDMAEDRISSAWGEETRLALAIYTSQVAQITDSERRPDRCVNLPTIWMALAALCVCDQSYVDLLNSSSANETRDEVEVRSYCVNHDDGSTMAVVDCRSCGPLCAECDRFLHLNRSARMHHRQICKEEESAIRIDIHEGCGRAKLFWLLLLVDRRTLKGLAEFRSLESVCDGQNFSTGEGTSTGFHGLAGTCRFCGARSTSGLLAIGNVCAEEQCQEFSREACTRVLTCGHVCGGVRGESSCLPCLMGCEPPEDALPLRQDADDMCMICFTDPLQAAPAIQLTCGHVFHLQCCKKVLICKWIGPRITFSFSQCPICKEDMTHWTLEELLAPIRLLREEVRRKALMRLEYEGLAEAQGAAATDAATFAMERYAYYVCHKCGKAYFGGLARCEAEYNGRWEPAELVCGGCSDVTGARVCPKHGSDFLEYKCRYCCSVAVFFCFGTSHFCNACHDDFQRVTNIPRHLLPQCPAGPKGEQLPGSSEECPLHVQHPPTGEEFALGCGVCRHSQAF